MLLKILIVLVRWKLLGGYTVAFLKFLKKRETEESLDVPPMPPLGTEQTSNEPEGDISEEEIMPRGADDLTLPELPPLPSDELPELKDFDKLPQYPMENKPDFDEPYAQPRQPDSSPAEEGPSFLPKGKKTIYLDMQKFKELAGDLQSIRSDLKEFNLILEEERKESTLYGKLHTNLGEVHRKLQFMDKTLFKG